MEFKDYIPVWDKLTDKQQSLLQKSIVKKTFDKNTIIHNGQKDCSGLYAIINGEFRIYIISDTGREVTLYRLFDRDICLFSASCMLKSIQFDVTIEAKKQTEAYVIPVDEYKAVMSESAPLANYTNELMSSRFTEVMWLLDQILWKGFDSRLAEFLLQESLIENTNILKVTHEEIGNHLGNPREVVTRMLKYFQNEEIVKLSRGAIEIIDIDKMRALANK